MSDQVCFICQLEPAEKAVPRYRFSVCKRCWDDNWVGWAREYEERIIRHLEHEGIAVPIRNIAHLLPRS